MYAGGKYGEGEDNYEFSLGLNGLGLCATQYASAWMTADIYRDGYHYHLDFKKGENVGGLQKEPYKGRRTGSIIHWKPDDEVFTDIDVPGSYYKDVCCAVETVVNGAYPQLPMKGKGPRHPVAVARAGATRTASRTMWQKWPARTP